jgi:hypothetical protein
MPQKHSTIPKQIARTCNEALHFIADQQERLSTFYSSLIVSALKDLDNTITNIIKEKAVAFLLAQRNADWSFNYSDHYPPDLDDTCIALRALHLQHPEIITEEVLAHVTSLLIGNEIAPGGPYQTWILPAHLQHDVQWHDIDIVVNSNIAIFLSELGIAMPRLQDYFEETILAGSFSSEYYYHDIVIIYFLAQAYEGEHKDMLVERLLQYRNDSGCWGNPLFTALAVSTLLRLGVDPGRLTSGIDHILATHKNGRWPPQPFFIETRSGTDITYSNCDAHVSACCVEAVTLYEHAIANSPDNNPFGESNTFIFDVSNRCKEVFANASNLLQRQFRDSLAELFHKDPRHEIPLLAYNFAEALNTRYAIDANMVIELAALNMLGWIGYSIYDSILDEEDCIGLLPMASMCIRDVTTIAQRFVGQSSGEAFIDHIFDGIAASTAWEYEHCRLGKEGDDLVIPEMLPGYGDCKVLAEKSLGHAIGPMLLCFLCNQVEQAKVVEGFFTHYLIARQLHDDAHDWLEDLRHGYINSVSVAIIEAWQKQSGMSRCNVEKEQGRLQEYFWQHHIDIVAKNINDHCSMARTELKKVTILRDIAFLEQLLVPLEQAAEQAIAERNSTRIFLSSLAGTTVLK